MTIVCQNSKMGFAWENIFLLVVTSNTKTRIDTRKGKRRRDFVLEKVSVQLAREN